MKRPALTEHRIACLKALADVARPRARASARSLYGFPKGNGGLIREAIEFVDELVAWGGRRVRGKFPSRGGARGPGIRPAFKQPQGRPAAGS